MELVGNVIPGIPAVSCELSLDNRRDKILANHTCRNEMNNSARHVGDISLIPRE